MTRLAAFVSATLAFAPFDARPSMALAAGTVDVSQSLVIPSLPFTESADRGETTTASTNPFCAAQGRTFPSVCSAQWVLKVLGPGLRVTAMNDRGDLAGAAQVADGAGSYPFIWTAKEGLKLLNQFPGGRATDVNNRGEVVGIEPGGGSEMDLGFLWSEATGAVRLGTFLPDSVNDRGIVGGSCSDWVTTVSQACLWAEGVVTPILVPSASGGCCSLGIWVNKHGMAAGCGMQGGCEPFLTTRRGELVLLDVPSDARVVEVNALNNRGETVGVAFPRDPYANPSMLLWNAKGAVTYIADAVLQMFGMNDKGQVAGVSYECGLAACVTRAAVWTAGDGAVILPDRGEGGQALAINRRGDIAGIVYVDGVQYGAIWSKERDTGVNQSREYGNSAPMR